LLGDTWITDRTPTERFPHYTRANAGEVAADPITPLGWTWGWESGVILGCRDGFVSYGVFAPGEYGDPPESFGSFGGYMYNCLTQARMMGVRMPGVTPEAIDDAYFDAHPDVPLYVAEDWHESPECSKKLEETGAYLLSATGHQPIEDHKVLAKQLRDSRPDLFTLSDESLVARAHEMQPHLQAMFEQHVWSSLGASNGPGILAVLLGEIGRTDDLVTLLTGIGDVDSADIGRDLWKLSRMVNDSPRLTAAFDAGSDIDLFDRVDDGFKAAFDDFIYNHGSRGPDEWDAGASSYETQPTLAFKQLVVMRKQTNDADPEIALERNGRERQRLAAELTEVFADNEEASAMFATAMRAGEVWLAARERTKGNNIRCIHEMRMCFEELGRRAAAGGHLADAKHIYMLLEDEVDDFVVDPAAFTMAISQRKVAFDQLFDLEPPFVVNGVCPPLSEWARKSDRAVEPVAVGDVLTGVACSPGVVTNRARVILDPSDPTALEPGEILVTQNTDPSWTPLFLAAGAVVVNVGAVASHASIVTRELGIPCVASVSDASRRIPDGAIITIDGAAGTVTIDSLP
jgi:phosphohistidine swiveling domain-containing protein